ncbi:MAG: cyclic nucleotide-binding domain-containing protein [Deltaproteobacteria bacterium]|nr:cyclic nucleotide-binding domain-containing protein [Deltaproteobacteria bacterium]
MTTLQRPNPKTLEGWALFGGLGRGGLELFADLADASEVKGGTVVFSEGDLGQDIFIVVKGSFGVFRNRGGEDTRLAVLETGEFFGEMSFIDMQPRAGTVRALEDSVVWRWSYGALRSSYQADPKSYTLMVMNIAREISRRLRRADDVIMNAKRER